MDTSNNTVPMQECKRCGTPLPRTTEYFAKAKSCKDGLRLVCRRCMTIRDMERYTRLRDEILEALRQDRQVNREYYREIDRKRDQSPHRKAGHAARTAKRRSLIKKAVGTFTAGDIELQLKSQRAKCWWCGISVKTGFHVDHLIPLARGGSNSPENIVISCPKCNTSRRDRLPHEWSDRLL